MTYIRKVSEIQLIIEEILSKTIRDGIDRKISINRKLSILISLKKIE